MKIEINLLKFMNLINKYHENNLNKLILMKILHLKKK